MMKAILIYLNNNIMRDVSKWNITQAQLLSAGNHEADRCELEANLGSIKVTHKKLKVGITNSNQVWNQLIVR